MKINFIRLVLFLFTISVFFQTEIQAQTIEKEALLYKELRELMSTKEFVEQYEIGLKDD